MDLKSKKYLFIDELINSITHGIGAALGIAALVLLVVFSSLYGNVWHIVSFTIYGVTLVILYTASTLFHSVRNIRVKYKLNKFDHASIFLLIAGTYTPFTLVTLRGPWGWTIFGIIWGIAILGILSKIFFMSRTRSYSAYIYLAMGWVIIIAIKPLIENLSTGGLIWLAAGGLSYSLGVIFFLWKKLPFSHGIWHLFVIGGSICHFFAIFLHLLP